MKNKTVIEKMEIALYVVAGLIVFKLLLPTLYLWGL
jgi:hypothetical protein